MSSNLLTFPSSQPNTRTNYLNIRLKSANLNKLEYTNCTSLVLYGSNLGSTINIGRLPRNVQKIVSLPSQLYSIVVGILLSDGWLEKENLNANTRFRFKQVLARSDYIIYSFLLLAHYCSSIPKIAIRERAGTITYGLQFCTLRDHCFNELYSLFYQNKIKVFLLIFMTY